MWRIFYIIGFSLSGVHSSCIALIGGVFKLYCSYRGSIQVVLLLFRFQRSLAAVRGADSPNRSYAMASVNPENPALLINVVRSKLLEDCIGIFSEVNTFILLLLSNAFF